MGRNATHTFDGLVVGYGTHDSDNDTPAVVSGGGAMRYLQVEILGTKIPDTASATNGIATPQAHIIPRGSIIHRATLQVILAFTGSGTPLVDIGLWSRGKTTEVVDDADGLWDGGTIAELTTVGEINVLDGALLPLADGVATGVVGLVSNSDCVVTVEWEANALTAGKALLMVEYQPPYLTARQVLAP